MRSLKELAINSANDSNTDEDRRTIQKEFIQRMDTINDIATTTAYNGKRLLDGTYAKKTLTITETTETSKPIEATGKPILIYAGDYTITENGVYSLTDGYTGAVTVNAQKVKLTQQTPATQLQNVSIVTRAEGNSNLQIENLNIAGTEDKNIIKFQGTDNCLILKGMNTFIKNNDEICAVINIGDGLTIVGNGSLSAETDGNGAAIGSDSNGTAGDITIGGNAIIVANSQSGAGIGGGSDYASLGDIKIGGNANVTATSFEHGAGIGSGFYYSSVGDILIGGNANVTATSRNDGAGIGNGGLDSRAGNISISNSATVNTSSRHAQNIGNGLRAYSVGTISIGQTTFDIDVNIDWQDDSGGMDTDITIITATESFGKPLRIHSGDNANQNMNIFIGDMHTKLLGAGKKSLMTTANLSIQATLHDTTL